MFKRILAGMMLGAVAVGGGCADVEDDGLQSDFRVKETTTATSVFVQRTDHKTQCMPDIDVWPFPGPGGQAGEDPDEWAIELFEAFEAYVLNDILMQLQLQITQGMAAEQYCVQSCDGLQLEYANEYELIRDVTVFGGPQPAALACNQGVSLSFDTLVEAALVCTCFI